MAKVTSKRQVTIPKRLATRYGIAPGDEIEWQAAGDAIRVVPLHGKGGKGTGLDVEERLRLFRAATTRLQTREAAAAGRAPAGGAAPEDRGWTRESLYVREKPE